MTKTLLATAAMAALATPALAGERIAGDRIGGDRCVAVTEQQVAAQFDRFNSAWATRDPKAVTALFAKDAVLLPTVSNTPRLNHAQIEDYFVGFLKNSPTGVIDTSKTSIGCNKATRFGTWTVNMKDPATGAVTPVKARYSFVYTYDGRDWKIYHLHSSTMPERQG